jgi:hypothetical protein
VRATVGFCLLTAADMLGLRLGRRLAAVDVGVEAVGYE